MKFTLTYNDSQAIVVDASDEAAALAQLQSAKGEGATGMEVKE